MYAAKKLLEGQGSTLLEGRQTGLTYDVTQPVARCASTRPSPGSRTPTSVLLVGSNIRWEAPLIATRVRKVARKGGKVFAIGPEVDLGMKVEWLGDDLKLLGKLPKAVTDAFAKAERPAVIVGPGALAAGALGAALALVEAARPHQGRLERLQRAPHLRLAHGGADPRLCAEGRHRRHRGGQARAGAAARRRRSRGRPLQGRVQGLYRPPRRRGRAAGRPGAAGRGLCREARHLRQHRRPRAARREGGLPAGRGARGLGDPARVSASLPARRCRSTASTSCARRWSRNIRSSAATG